MVLIGIIVVVVAVIVVVDVVSTPTPTGTRCVLKRYILLPDKCVGACDPLFGCPPTSTRPYMIFFTQAATCPDNCVRLP